MPSVATPVDGVIVAEQEEVTTDTKQIAMLYTKLSLSHILLSNHYASIVVQYFRFDFIDRKNCMLHFNVICTTFADCDADL